MYTFQGIFLSIDDIILPIIFFPHVMKNIRAQNCIRNSLYYWSPWGGCAIKVLKDSGVHDYWYRVLGIPYKKTYGEIGSALEFLSYTMITNRAL